VKFQVEEENLGDKKELDVQDRDLFVLLNGEVEELLLDQYHVIIHLR
jgi:hypothetical protein